MKKKRVVHLYGLQRRNFGKKCPRVRGAYEARQRIPLLNCSRTEATFKRVSVWVIGGNLQSMIAFGLCQVGMCSTFVRRQAARTVNDTMKKILSIPFRDGQIRWLRLAIRWQWMVKTYGHIGDK